MENKASNILSPKAKSMERIKMSKTQETHGFKVKDAVMKIGGWQEFIDRANEKGREELKPCPYCGAPAMWWNDMYVICQDSDCEAEGPLYDFDGHKWNSIPRVDDGYSGMAG
jgi:hypothetical protein